MVAPPQSVPVSKPFFSMSLQLGAWHAFVVQTPLAQSLAPPQAWLVAQRGQVVVPPQSVSLSPPFFTASEQVAALQVPDVQTPLAQSPATVQILFVAQRMHAVDPPQSASLSPWFLTPSPQVGAWHLRGAPEQTRLWQSDATLHDLVAAQGPHVPPPQSTSVSVPFFARSVQATVWHVPLGQKPEVQSAPLPHFLPTAHLVPQVPPQSTSVSPPFCTPSGQIGGLQVTLHTPLTQSLAPVHVLLSGHLGHPGPQSVSLSLPFFTPSVQSGALQVPAGQTPFWQSPGPAHTLPVPHLPQTLPPQSLSVSLPFFTRSEHVGV